MPNITFNLTNQKVDRIADALGYNVVDPFGLGQPIQRPPKLEYIKQHIMAFIKQRVINAESATAAEVERERIRLEVENNLNL